MTDTTQRSHVLDALIAHGWNVAAVEDGDWWADEVVLLESTWSPVTAELVLTFLVDPMHDGPRQKGEHVWAVMASKERLEGRGSGDGPLLSLGRGWQAHLSEFVAAVEKLRV